MTFLKLIIMNLAEFPLHKTRHIVGNWPGVIILQLNVKINTVFLLLSLTAICASPSASSDAESPKYLWVVDPMAFFSIVVRNLIGPERKEKIWSFCEWSCFVAFRSKGKVLAIPWYWILNLEQIKLVKISGKEA